MKAKILSVAVLVFFFIQAPGQTFNDCGNEYANQHKKMSLELTLKKITESTADSIINQINDNLDECIIGKEIPDIELVGKSGKVYTTENLKGKVVMLNFWSVNCPPCIMEIPVLNKLQDAYKGNDEFLFLSILIDKEDDLQKFLEQTFLGIRHANRNISFEVVPNSKPLLKSTFNFVKAYPTNLFIDREGKVFMKTLGGVTDSKFEEELELKLRSIIDTELNKS